MVGSPCSIGVRRIAWFCSYWKLHPHGSFGFHYAPFPCGAPLECCAQSWHTRWPSKDEPCPWFISYFLGWKKLHWPPLAWKGLKQLNSDYSTYELGVQGSCCMSKATLWVPIIFGTEEAPTAMIGCWRQLVGQEHGFWDPIGRKSAIKTIWKDLSGWKAFQRTQFRELDHWCTLCLCEQTYDVPGMLDCRKLNSSACLCRN